MTRVHRADFRFNISDDAFEVLKVQRGDIYDLSHDRNLWEDAYTNAIFAKYGSIVGHIPQWCSRIVDIGAGLGGIDAVLNKHYGGFVEVCPIDGEMGEPTGLDKKATMLSGEKLTRAFLNANGVTRVSPFAPNALPAALSARLIVSFASWCFHYPPGVYLRFVKASLVPDGILVVDIRRDKPLWRKLLGEIFSEVAVVAHGRKFDRVVYGA